MRKLMSLRQCARYLGIPYQTLSNRRLRMPKDIPYTIVGSAKMVDPEVVRKRLTEMGYKVQQSGLERDTQYIALVGRAGSGADADDEEESQKKKKKEEKKEGNGEDEEDEDEEGEDEEESPPSAPAQPDVGMVEGGISNTSSDRKKLNQFVLYRTAEEMLCDIDCGILQAGDGQCGQFKV